MPQLFFEILGEPAELGNEYEFSSVEVKQTAFRIDGVFTPRRDSAQKTIIFAEFQLQKDEAFYERFFAEIMLYLSQNLDVEDWKAVVVYPRRSVEQKKIYRHRSFLNSEQFQVVYLEDFLGLTTEEIGIQLMQLIVAKESEANRYVDRLVEHLRGKTTPQDKQIIELVSTIMLYKFSELSQDEVQAMFTISDLKQTRVYREAVDEGMERGIERGLEQALEREQYLLIRLLTRKIGVLSPELTDKVKSLSFEELEQLGEALFDFEQLEDLENWLDNP